MNLDNLKQIKKLDSSDVVKSIELFPYQIEQVLKDLNKFKLPKKKKTINQVVIVGMGASNLGPEIVKSLFLDQIKVPISIYHGYQIPASVNKNTLFILSSYSGNTEETLSAYKEAKKKKAQTVILTSGGKLGQTKSFGYVFNSKNNPSNVPRIGIGYSVSGIMVLLSKFGLLKIDRQLITKSVANLADTNKKLVLEVKITKNSAKKLALKIHNKQIVVVGSEFLAGNIKTFRNQFCETGKNFASYLLLPNLNHFVIEGLGNPKSNSKNMLFLFINTNLYDKRIQKRNELTKKIVKKNKIEILNINLKSKTKLEQSFELLQLGTWVTYYLGLLNNSNPATNDFVDWFKKRV